MQIAEQRGHFELATLLRTKHHAVTDARDKAASAAAAAAYAAAEKERQGIIPIVSPVEDVIAQGLVSLAVAGDIINGGKLETAAAGSAASPADGSSSDDAHDAYMRKNAELEAQLGDVERKIRLDRLYSTRPSKPKPRVYS